MITFFSADNFKSLNNIKLPFTGFSVLVGNNASGKSTVLQAIDFLMRSASEDFLPIIEKRGFVVSDIVSRFSTKRQIRFTSEYILPLDEKKHRFRWELVIDTIAKENRMKLAFERITDLENNRVLLSYGPNKILEIDDGYDSPRGYSMVSLDSSSLKVFVDIQSEKKIPELVALKRFLISSCSYDMLSPLEMRQSSRGRTYSIGTSGRDLASYIKTMSKEQKDSFMKNVHSLLGKRVLENIEAHTKGKPGWTTIESVERFGDKKVRISSKGMSDGMLRILAFVAIHEMKTESSLVLLDEIENGINSNYAENLIKLMKHSYEEKQRQIIVTTHSTTFLDYVDASCIIYLFRDKSTGFSRAIRLLDITGMNERVEYMYPGEIFMNLSNAEIMDLVMKSEDVNEGF